MKLAIFCVFLFLFISQQVITNCNTNSAGLNTLAVDDENCQDSTLCKIQCSEVGGPKKISLMKLNVDDPNIPDQVKDAYFKTCTWELERKEILTDIDMVNPQGRGQIISQFMANLGRQWRDKLPKPITPVAENTLEMTEDVEENTLFLSGILKKVAAIKDKLQPVKVINLQPQPPKALPAKGSLVHAIAVNKPDNSKGKPPIKNTTKGVGGIGHARKVGILAPVTNDNNIEKEKTEPVKPIKETIPDKPKPVEPPKPVVKPQPIQPPKPVVKPQPIQPPKKVEIISRPPKKALPMKGSLAHSIAVVQPVQPKPTKDQIESPLRFQENGRGGIDHAIKIGVLPEKVNTEPTKPEKPTKTDVPKKPEILTKTGGLGHAIAVQEPTDKPEQTKLPKPVKPKPLKPVKVGNPKKPVKVKKPTKPIQIKNPVEKHPHKKGSITHSTKVKQPETQTQTQIRSPASIWVPTPNNLRDWVDFLLYVSNQYTFFQDLCNKHGNPKDALKALEKKLFSDAEVALYKRYKPQDQPKIREFVAIALDKILKQFYDLYQDPTKTCGCLDIIKEIIDDKQKQNFRSVLQQTCNGKDNSMMRTSDQKLNAENQAIFGNVPTIQTIKAPTKPSNTPTKTPKKPSKKPTKKPTKKPSKKPTKKPRKVSKKK